MPTWEDEHLLRNEFPTAPAWGQAGFQGRGIVTDAAKPSLPRKTMSKGGPNTPNNEPDTSDAGVKIDLAEASGDGLAWVQVTKRSKKPNQRFLGLEWVR